MDIRNALKESIASSLNGLGISVEAQNVPLEHPAELKNGDYSSGVALQYAKQAGTAPQTLAIKVAEEIAVTEAVKISVAKPGFINFYLSTELLTSAIEEARTQDMWGSNTLYKGKKIMVEYTDPNPFKEFHIGHLMSNAIGESIARLMQFSGANVTRANYQGDVGPHVAKSIWGRMQNPKMSWGKAYTYGTQNYANNKPTIDIINKKIYERSDKEINAIYDKGVIQTLKGFEKIYKQLGMDPVYSDNKDQIYFDFYFYESHTWKDGVELVKKYTPKIFTPSKGAIVFCAEEYDKKLHTRVFVTSQGLPTYEAKELGLVKAKQERYRDRFKVDFDSSITITANEQSEYFKVVMKAAELIFPDLSSKIKHISSVGKLKVLNS